MPSKLEQLQLQFRQRLKEERMIKIHTDNQQKALSKVSKYNGVLTTTHPQTVPKPSHQPAIQPPSSHHSPIKKGSPGVDRSRPLPPISKDSSRNSSSSRSSPTSPPNEPVIVKPTVGTRSVDLEPRQTSPKPAVVPTRAPPRNGLASNRQPHTELRQPVVHSQEPVLEKRPDPELLNKLKQAELQRLRANNRVREDVPSRNGITSTARASNELRKAVKPSAPAPAPSRPRPKPQATAPAAPRRAAPSNKPQQRAPAAPSSRSAPSSSSSTRKPPGPGQAQCNVCGRNFNQDRIEKHASICKKAASKKVKVFDATKMRVKGTEAEQFVRKGVPKTEPKMAKKADWRKKHNEFIEAIRQAKMVQQHLAKGGKVSDLPPPPPSDTSDYVPCPHCGRKFNEGVAERHIPKCKDIRSNKKNPVPARRK